MYPYFCCGMEGGKGRRGRTTTPSMRTKGTRRGDGRVRRKEEDKKEVAKVDINALCLRSKTGVSQPGMMSTNNILDRKE